MRRTLLILAPIVLLAVLAFWAYGPFSDPPPESRVQAYLDLRVLAVTVAVCAFVAGFLLRKRGALTGFGSVLLVSAAWAFFVMARAWVAGDLSQTFPGCDPCGFVGHAGRMIIVTLTSLGTFGLLAAVSGGLGELVARRARRQPSVVSPGE